MCWPLFRHIDNVFAQSIPNYLVSIGPVLSHNELVNHRIKKCCLVARPFGFAPYHGRGDCGVCSRFRFVRSNLVPDGLLHLLCTYGVRQQFRWLFEHHYCDCDVGGISP